MEEISNEVINLTSSECNLGTYSYADKLKLMHFVQQHPPTTS